MKYFEYVIGKKLMVKRKIKKLNCDILLWDDVFK